MTSFYDPPKFLTVFIYPNPIAVRVIREMSSFKIIFLFTSMLECSCTDCMPCWL